MTSQLCDTRCALNDVVVMILLVLAVPISWSMKRVQSERLHDGDHRVASRFFAGFSFFHIIIWYYFLMLWYRDTRYNLEHSKIQVYVVDSNWAIVEKDISSIFI